VPKSRPKLNGGLHGRVGLVMVLLAVALPAAALYVAPDGSGDFATIQDAFNAAAEGDTILLGDGVFTGDGNRDLDYLGKALTVRSLSGEPDSCVIDCQATLADPHRGFYFHLSEDSTSVLEGVTVRGGVSGYPDGVWPNNTAGAVLCVASAPWFRRCVFTDNLSRDDAGAVLCYSGSPARFDSCSFVGNTAVGVGGGLFSFSSSETVVRDCLFRENTAFAGGACVAGSNTPLYSGSYFSGNRSQSPELGGGAVMAYSSASPILIGCVFAGNAADSVSQGSPGYGGALLCLHTSRVTARSCTFDGNSSPLGSALALRNSARLEITHCILSGGLRSPSAYCEAQTEIVVGCTDDYGNAGGDWVGCLAGLEGVDGNFSGNPIFCDAAAGDYHLHQDSPCLPGGHPGGADCGLIGALPIGCPAAGIAEMEGGVRSAQDLLAVPNPFSGGTGIRFVVSAKNRKQAAQLLIFDAGGRLVRTLTDRPRESGDHVIGWDGRDEAGRDLPGGWYFLRLAGGDDRGGGRVLRVR